MNKNKNSEEGERQAEEITAESVASEVNNQNVSFDENNKDKESCDDKETISKDLENKTWYAEGAGIAGETLSFFVDENGEQKAVRQIFGSGVPVVKSEILDVAFSGQEAVIDERVFSFDAEKNILVSDETEYVPGPLEIKNKAGEIVDVKDLKDLENITEKESVDSIKKEKVDKGSEENDDKDKEQKDEKEGDNNDREDDTKKAVGSISSDFVYFGHSKSGRRDVDTVIIHSVYNTLGGEQYSFQKVLGIFKKYNVSAHYVIDRDGIIHQLVSEKHVSWHAGKSKTPDGRTNVNDFSIGIELITGEDDKPAEKQYQALKSLLAGIKSRHKIKYILGHYDIAPGRKTDPWNFDWSKIGGKIK